MESLKLLKIPKNFSELKMNPKHRKNCLSKSITILDSKFKKRCDYREYYNASGSTCYVVVWFHSKNVSFSISGTAGGYGYDKASAALSSSLLSAGFKFNQSFSGAGQSAIERALELVAKKLNGNKKLHTIVTFP